MIAPADGQDSPEVGLDDDEAPPIARTHAANLEPRQRIAAWSLACGDEVREAASKAKVHRNTIRRWMRDEHFAAAVDDGVALLLSFNQPAENAARFRVTQKSPSAADRLVALLDSEDENVRLKAASTILQSVGIGGKGGNNVAVQVNVNERHAEILREADEILEAEPSE